jgi:prepilin-type N-terminal cleavage/methylation domain-containing protein/prepilin-type processing-associated H-X9-DG protein
MISKRRGFTLIELLVVIAIIAILAAMLFPVFARARESARKIQCLANVKNIATAFQMYLTDYDKLPPREHRTEVIDYFAGAPGAGDGAEVGGDGIWCANQTNPYLRFPVVLDEYVKNRDVWRCPSAKMVTGASWILPGPDWFSYIRTREGQWGTGFPGVGPCWFTYPPGWGGTITDSLIQGVPATYEAGARGPGAGGAFEMTIGVHEGTTHEVKPSQVADAASFTICGDGGSNPQDNNLGTQAYPDLCNLECANPVCCGPDWQNCPGAAESSACAACILLHAPGDGSFLRDPNLRKPYARHLGGVNLGFLDGHAAWVNSESVISRFAAGTLTGLDVWGPTSTCGFAQDYPGVPTIY